MPLHEATHVLRLAVAVLEQEPSARSQVVRGASDQGPDRTQSVATRSQRGLRLVAQREQVRIVLGDVRRVAHDEVEATVADGLPPVASQPLDGEPKALAVCARDGE